MTQKPTQNVEDVKAKQLINPDEIKDLIGAIPKIAQAQPGVRLLIAFVGKVVGGVNHLDERFSKERKSVRDRLDALEKTVKELSDRAAVSTGSDSPQ